MLMRSFKHIDNEDFYPKEYEHVEYSEVFRATKNINDLSVIDFLPSSIEYANQFKTFTRKFVQSDYSVSVFTDLDALKATVKRFPSLDAKTKAYAKGFTTINRGISHKENSNHHVNYFLYDYELNSPKNDFSVIEVR